MFLKKIKILVFKSFIVSLCPISDPWSTDNSAWCLHGLGFEGAYEKDPCIPHVHICEKEFLGHHIWEERRECTETAPCKRKQHKTSYSEGLSSDFTKARHFQPFEAKVPKPLSNSRRCKTSLRTDTR